MESGREIAHLHDGVIPREHYERGVLARREDLNRDGRTIREQLYRDGKLAERRYTNRDGLLVSRELFDADGLLTETIYFDRRNSTGTEPKEMDHWRFQRGMPVKQLKEGREFTRQGVQWVSAGQSKKKKAKSQPSHSEGIEAHRP